MTLKEAYIHIQQGLQNIAAFVYSDVQLPELDYFWKQATYKFIDLAFPNIDDNDDATRRNEIYSQIQATLDDLRVLEVDGYSTTLVPFTIGKYTGKGYDLPTNYYYLINDRTILSVIGCTTGETREVPNTLCAGTDIINKLENSLYKTSVGSPLSKITGGHIYVYDSYRNIKQFTIESVLIDYIKKPIDYTYNINANTTLEFPDNVCFKIIKVALLYMASVAEQNPNKIQLINKT